MKTKMLKIQSFINFCLSLISTKRSKDGECAEKSKGGGGGEVGGGLEGYGNVMKIGRFLVQTPQDTQPSLGIQPCYEVPDDFGSKL